MAKKPKSRQKQSRLADPVTYVAMDVVMAEAKARFEPRSRLLAAEIKALFDKFKEGGLTATEEVQMILLRAHFDALAIEYRQFIDTALAARLGPGDGNELLGA